MFAVYRISKYRLIALSAALMLTLSLCLVALIPQSTGQAQAVTIAIDAGHGGYDGGVTGLTTHIKESDVNLSIALYLAAYLKAKGYRVVLTRDKDRSPVETGSLKRQDMDMRLATIESANADIAVSLHCNFYPSVYRRGIQVFYDKAADLPLAEALQNHLNKTQNLPDVGRQFAPLWGDYYLLKKASCPAAIIECGFLSNPEDECLLKDADYRMTLAYQIYVAIDGIYAGADQVAQAY
jgi:N-acetylmuramoyl-L-alanine amidase